MIEPTTDYTDPKDAEIERLRILNIRLLALLETQQLHNWQLWAIGLASEIIDDGGGK
jgi:hypothetical protein